MGHVFDFKEADTYDTWLAEPKNQYWVEMEIRLMMSLLEPKKGQRILDIGCGTGASLKPIMGMGLSLTGIDPSPYMLDIAEKNLGYQVDFHRGFGEDLPFDDNAFESALFVTSLEFMDRPAKAIEEACRVARERVVICVLNRYAILNIARRCKGFFVNTLYTRAKFFSASELKQILFAILGNVPVISKTTLQFPFLRGPIISGIENNRFIQKSCFGTLIGMMIQPVPKFRTRPLSLKIKKPSIYKPATGLATRLKS
jgi:ubiquinone/menaquinone biosynthesis C-methylase UbiE